MACTVVAYIVMANTSTAYTARTYIVLAYIAMASVVIPRQMHLESVPLVLFSRKKYTRLMRHVTTKNISQSEGLNRRVWP